MKTGGWRFESFPRYLQSHWNQPLGPPECPYAFRWTLDFGRLGSIRLHKWIGDDDTRAPHDHPSDFITLVLKGRYADQHIGQFGNGIVVEQLKPGSIKRRKAEHRHMVKLLTPTCWTLLYFWPKRRNWGFWVKRKVDGSLKFMKSNKYFLTHGHHPCDD